MSERLDRWLPATIREEIERRFYAKVNEQAALSRLVHDPDFMAAPPQHVGLFADHGVVHARDIASQVLDVLAACHGVLIPYRNPQRFALMQGYGVLLAYFHDIGMIDFSGFGRSMHPEFAAQAVFDPALDDLIELIWRENSGGMAWQIMILVDKGLIVQDPKLVLRELLSLSICHSKSKIPVAMLNEPDTLRASLINTVTTDLRVLFSEQQMHKPQQATALLNSSTDYGRLNPQIERFSHLFPAEAYCWLTDGRPELVELVSDVVDTVRALRAADALRQRGTVLETSGHYQIFVDQHHGSAVYALRLGKERLYLLELSDPISAGEANIASSEFERSGDLRISFHRGSFSGPGAKEHAARSAALVVSDIQRDVIESFGRTSASPGLKKASEMLILLEETADDATFTQMVHDELARLDANLAECVRITPSLTHADPEERARYLAAAPITWAPTTRREIFAHMALSGYPAERVDQERAFDSARLLTIHAGDVLIEAGTPPSFVYLPLGHGLEIVPLGGYSSFPAQPWQLLGVTGAVRGAERSATIVAEREVQVLMIPKAAYLAYWHHTLSLEEFQGAIAGALAETSFLPATLSQLEKSTLLRSVPLFKTLNQQAIADLASRAREVRVAERETVVSKGSFGKNLFVVIEGSLRVHDDTYQLGKLGPGDVFGEMAAITPELRTASVTATEESSLLQLSHSDLNDLMDNNIEVARGIIEVLAGYVRDRTADVIRLKQQLEEQATGGTHD